MPARHTSVPCVVPGPTQLTDGAVAAARIDNPNGYEVWLQATATSTPPASRLGQQRLGPYSTLAADLPLADLFLGIGPGPYFLWAFVDVPVSVGVSHG